MDYSILELDTAYLEQLEEIEKECFSVPWTRDMLCHELTDGMHRYLGAVCENRLLGYVGMMSILDEGYISNVAVREEYRRRGIGRALISRMLEAAKENKLSFVTLEVRQSNAAAISLYSTLGFKTVGERKNYYEKPRESAILMTRFFPDKSL